MPTLKQEPFSWELLTDRGVEVLFLATPHEQSREWVPEALKRGIRVIDLSGAWRLTEAANRAVYAFTDEGTEQAAIIQKLAVYGMPELHRAEIKGAKLIANPGCYATSVILPVGPLVPGGADRSGPWRHRRFEKRREWRRQGTDREDTLYVCGRQSFRVRRIWASSYGRVAGADRRYGGRNNIHSAPAADSTGNFVHDLRAIQAAADSRVNCPGLQSVLSPQAR